MQALRFCRALANANKPSTSMLRSIIAGSRRHISVSSTQSQGVFDFIKGRSKTPTAPVVDKDGKVIDPQQDDSSEDIYSEVVDIPANLPIMTSRRLASIAPTCLRAPRQAWLDTLKCQEDVKLGLVDLHPDVFAANPRIDIVHKNLVWQAKYRVVDWRCTTTPGELSYRSTRKPWPQKGTGRARHGTRRSPLFLGGGQSKGPRGPISYYYILPQHMRVTGLLTMLTVKQAQGQLRVIDGLELPTSEPEYLQELVDKRNWGPSVLFVSHKDTIPRNIALATQEVNHLNLMPVYGLNVWSMVKHDSLVVTLPALELIEERLLRQLKLCDNNSIKEGPWNEPIKKHFTGFPLDKEEILKYQ